MILTLLAVSLNDQALSRPITASFDTTGGTIGRADHSTMALPDPERFISRKQAEIAFVGNGYTIRNVGAANPITVAQRTLAAGEAAPLRHGDEVRIGGYLLRAECRLDPVGAGPMSADVAATVVSSAQALAPGLAGRGGPARAPQPARPVVPPAAAAPGVFSTSAPLAKDNPFADLFGPSSSPSSPSPSAPLAPAAIDDDPFAGLMPGPAGLDPALGSVASSAPAAQPRLPDDFDPFATMDSGPRKAGGTPARPPAPGPAFIPDDPLGGAPAGASDDPFADLLGIGGAGGAGAGTPSIDQAFGLGSADPGSDALARFMGEPAPASSAGAPGSAGGVPTDPLLLFGADGGAVNPAAGARPASGPPVKPAAGQAAGAAALPDHLPALHGAFAPPRVAAPAAVSAAHIPATVVVQPTAAPVPRAEVPAPQATPAPRRAARPPAPPALPAAPVARAPAPVPNAAPGAMRGATPGASADTAALWRAFCEGAGVDLPAPAGEGEALMRHLGRVMRSAVEGTLQLIAVRASTKHEMRAAVTQIRSTMNNPLKFSPDAVSGLEQLLSPPQRGFMDGATAMDDAMLDLVGHSIGTVAGMRAAIEGMLDRFDPAALEGKLGAGSRLANLLPMNRKARLWELYLQHHRQIRDEAEEDFHTLFGRAFVAAYEQQVDQLERQQRQRQRAARR